MSVTGALACLVFLLANVFLTLRYYLALLLPDISASLVSNQETIELWKSYTPKVIMMLPGVNIPLDHLLYLVCALLVSAVVHEAGHGLAASTEGLRIDSVGFMLFWGVPAAFVGLPLEILKKPVSKQLKVFCAGVWHNVVLCVFVFFVSMIVVPYLLL